MFSKLTTILIAFAFVLASGLSINAELQPGSTKILAEITQTALADVPQFEWESHNTESAICHSWISFTGWDLFGICDIDIQWGDKTLDDLKNHADANNYDGFTVIDNTAGVWYKKCGDLEPQHALNVLT